MRVFKRLAKGQNTELTEIYTAGPNTITNIVKLLLTNTSDEIKEFSVYTVSNGVDQLVITDKIAAGVGKARVVYEVSDLALNESEGIKLSGELNYELSGWEVD
jgi:hypothetical protein